MSKTTFFFPSLHRLLSVFQIVLPPHLERIREKLAENSHELWAVTRIEQGWTFGPVGVSVLPIISTENIQFFLYFLFCFVVS